MRAGAFDPAPRHCAMGSMCIVRPLNSNCDVHSSVPVGHCLQVATVRASGRGGRQFLPQCSDAFSPSKLILPCAVEPCFIAIEC